MTYISIKNLFRKEPFPWEPPIPVVMQSKAYVYGHWLSGIVGSNPTGDMVVSLLCLLCFIVYFCFGLITHPEESYRLWCV